MPPPLRQAHDLQDELVGLKGDLRPTRRGHCPPDCDLALVESSEATLKCLGAAIAYLLPRVIAHKAPHARPKDLTGLRDPSGLGYTSRLPPPEAEITPLVALGKRPRPHQLPAGGPGGQEIEGAVDG